jgi:hypothetical protein
MYPGGESPEVELSDGTELWIEVEGDEVSGFALSPRSKQFDTSIGISLASLRIDLQNQTYGMISASTGCYSNVGGPGC